MILLLKKIKCGFIRSGKIHKYLLYAFGEMLLVIMGILVALQIDNWNTEVNNAASLKSYLESISRNVTTDLQELTSIR